MSGQYGATTATRAPGTTVSVSEYIDSRGWRNYHLLVVGLSAGAQAFAGACVASLPLLLDELRLEFGSGRTMLGVVGSCLLFGSLAGTLVGGMLSDACGRRTTLLAGLISGGMVSLLHLAVVELWHLAVVRLLLGVCFGMIVVVMNVYIVEFVPSWTRAKYVCIAGIGWEIGVLISTVLPWLVRGRWRMVLSFPVVPAVFVSAAVLRFAPESPRWLFLHSQDGSAMEVLQRIYGPESPAPDRMPSGGMRLASAHVRIRDMFAQSLLPTTAIAITLWTVNVGASYSWGLWAPELLKMLLHAEAVPYKAAICAQVAAASFQLTYAFFLDPLGRRPMLTVSGLGVATLLSLFTLVPRTYAVIIGIFVILQLPWEMFWSVKIIFTKEAFPTELRGTANGACNVFGRLSGASSQILMGWLVDRSVKMSLHTLSAAMLFVALVACLIPVETAQKHLRDVVV